MNDNWSRQDYEPNWNYMHYGPLPIYGRANTYEEYDPMTTCIAGMANEGKTLVLVADKLSIDVKKLVRQSETRSKILPLDDTHYVLIAGNETFGYDVYRRVVDRGATYRSTREYADGIAEAYLELRFKDVEASQLGPLGYNRDSFRLATGEMSSSAVEFIVSKMQAIGLDTDNTEIMVVGIDSAINGLQASIFSVKAPGKVVGPATDFHSISTVNELVLDFLKTQEYSNALDEDHAAYLLFEAKKMSEISMAIGEKTDLFILDESGIHPVDAEILKALQGAYNELHKPLDGERERLFTKVGRIRRNS